MAIVRPRKIYNRGERSQRDTSKTNSRESREIKRYTKVCISGYESSVIDGVRHSTRASADLTEVELNLVFGMLNDEYYSTGWVFPPMRLCMFMASAWLSPQ